MPASDHDYTRSDPLKWALAQNMVLGICIKAMLTKLDPEVGTEVVRAMNAVPDADPFLRQVVANTMERVLPDAVLQLIYDQMGEGNAH